METATETKIKPLFKRLGWAGIGLCGLCCALPFIGVAAGVGSLTAIGMFIEKVAILLLGLAGIFFTWHWLLKRKAAKKSCETSCETDCDCKEELI